MYMLVIAILAFIIIILVGARENSKAKQTSEDRMRDRINEWKEQFASKTYTIEMLEELLKSDIDNAVKASNDISKDFNIQHSKVLAAELKKRTGRDYKDAETVCRERAQRGYSYSAQDIANLKKIQGMVAASAPPEKKASVTKRAVVGGMLAGPAGAVVGAISAADENSRKKG